MKKYSFVFAVLLSGCATNSQAPLPSLATAPENPVIGTTASWKADGKAALHTKLKQKHNTRQAKNVILFIGDGMGVSTLTAGRILEGQLNGNPGEENLLPFEHFPHTALVKTYNVDAQVPDSAGTATALNTGAKTRAGAINTAPQHLRGVCADMMDDAPTPIAEYAERAGMSTGIVTTARLSHATPAAVYAHSPERDWEADIDLSEEAIKAGCPDITSQITTPLGGNGLEVALGGGRSNFLPLGPEGGRRNDGRNIVTEWKNTYPEGTYVTTKAELAAVDYKSTSHLLGAFSPSHMDYDDRRSTEQPELADMTEAAIKMLSKNKKGYYLMVEAGRIDHGHHEGNAHKALYDTVALAKAVRRTLELVDTRDTLILVTADHSHTFTMAGYAERGTPILGLAAHSAIPGGYFLDLNNKPYTTVGYANGPGAVTGERPVLTNEITTHPDYKQQSHVPLEKETHGGEDVALFAIGPWSHLAAGTIEQNMVFHIMDHALGLQKRAAKK